MQNQADNNSALCRKETIAAYYDGDLSPSAERDTEAHLSRCGHCSEYLNSLKMVSTSLEIYLDEEPVPIPGEFSKRVAAAAESDMEGLRSSKERSRAVLIGACILVCAALAVSVGVVGFGPGLSELPSMLLALGSMSLQFLYNLAASVSVILGTIVSQLFSGSTMMTFLAVSILFLSILIFSKHLLRFHRS